MNLRILAGLAMLGLATAPVAAQQPPAGLQAAAEAARTAWLGHQAAALVASSPRLLLQLPGADPATALGQAQAAALLDDYLAGTDELGVTIRSAREVEPGRGFVELVRRYRVRGTQDVRVQTLLLGYRSAKSGWSLVELRVVG